jgi:hypothetical protein
MAETIPYGRKTQRPSPVREVHNRVDDRGSRLRRRLGVYGAAPDRAALFIEDAVPPSAFVYVASLSSGHLSPARVGGS